MFTLIVSLLWSVQLWVPMEKTSILYFVDGLFMFSWVALTIAYAHQNYFAHESQVVQKTYKRLEEQSDV